jgi:hypothetical protein
MMLTWACWRELMIGWQKWNGDYVEHMTLKSLGLHIQLGHPPGDTCYNCKLASGDNFIVIDVNGVFCYRPTLIFPDFSLFFLIF